VPRNSSGPPHKLTDLLCERADGCLSALRKINWSRLVIFINEIRNQRSHIARIDEIALCNTSSPTHHFFSTIDSGLVKASDKRWNYMTFTNSKVIVLTIKITWNEHTRLHTILRPIGFSSNNSHLLGT